MSTRKFITSYKWPINDFNQQMSIVRNGGSIKSGIFSLNGNSKAKFLLKLERSETDGYGVYLVCNQFGHGREIQLDVKGWLEGNNGVRIKYDSKLTVSKPWDTYLLMPGYAMKQNAINNLWTVCCEIEHEEPICGFEEDNQEELIARREFNRKLFALQSNGCLDGTVTIQAGNKEFKANKFTLMAYSDVFHRMFSCEGSIEAKTGILKIDNIKPEAIDALIRWIYQVEVENMEDIAMDLYHAADKYQIGFLKEKCIKVMANSLSNENLAPRLILAYKFNEEKFKKHIFNFFRRNNKNWKKLVASDEWLKFSAEDPEEAKKIISEIPD